MAMHEMDETKKMDESRKRNLDSEEKSETEKEVRDMNCRRCGKKHKRNKCPKMTCFKCEGKGHGRDVCPSEETDGNVSDSKEGNEKSPDESVDEKKKEIANTAVAEDRISNIERFCV